MSVELELVNLGSENGDRRGENARDVGAKINRNAVKTQAALNGMTGLGLVKGATTTLPAGASFDFSLSGSGPVYALNMSVPAGAAGAGAPTSPDILAIAEMSRLERSLAAAGVPDEASLILDFIRGVHFASKTAIAASIETLIAALPASSFTRASTGTFTDSDGLLKTAANNVPRIDYDPITRQRRGLLIENQARTNLFTYSEQIDDASYSKTRVSVAANAAPAPDGLLTADKVVENTENNTHIIGKTATVVSGVVATCSMYVRAAGRSRCRLQFDGGGPIWANATFDLLTGAVSGLSGSGAVASASDCGGGWWRISVTGTTTGTSARAIFYFINDAGSNSYAGDGVSGLYLWGSQLEAGAAPSSYIPTVASTVTRAADALTLMGGAWLTNGAMSAMIECRLNEVRADGLTSLALIIQNAARTDFISLREGSVIGGVDLFSRVAGVGQIDSSSYALSTGVVTRIALGVDATTYGLAKDNAITVTGGASTPPVGLDRMIVGAERFMGHIRRILYFPQRLSNAKVQALSGSAWS